MTVSDTSDVQQVYKLGIEPTSGTVGHLDDAQEKALKDLWARVFEHFDKTQEKPILVDKGLAKSGLSAAGIARDDSEAVAKWYSENQSKVTDMKYQLVQDKLYLEGNHEPLVPASFSPLFGDPSDSRTFYNAFWRAVLHHRTPDTYLLSFLKTSGWDVNKAFVRLEHSVTRRIQQDIDRLMWEGDLIQNNQLFKNGLCIQSGKDKFGYPVFVVTVRLNVPKERTEADVEKFAAYSLEKAAQLARSYNDRAVLVYDFTGFKLENVDTAFSKTIITTIQELYPQTFMATLLFVNSWLFSGIWKVIRGWIDPMVVRRTIIVKDIKALQDFIDLSQIPKSMGGELESEFQYVYPQKEENHRMADQAGRLKAERQLATAVDSFIGETRKWTDGSVDSHNAESRAQAAAAFDSAATELDLYIRARFFEER
ncbi:phosphatidylinositol transfer protein csr1 [Coemansia sp. RSA 989]|nr:CRAL-TRIO domain-containing protein [Coemansia mojavensis]KAJ1751988.1 phosphatidylinositol transfer protein csr1 [Coemansia sp. RSA 1821]KAJ1866857.1 phosphatidylinositol transfer protein csr1 [Coemansia sp. RSA 989]